MHRLTGLAASLGLLSTVGLLSSVAWSQQSAAPVATESPDDRYVAGPDSQRHPEVPQGVTFQFTFAHSKVFPATSRTIYVYVPAQYTGEKPACVYIGLDRLAFEAPTVFDNLIDKHEMPITIGIGVSSGTVASSRPPTNPRFNRSFEFDGLNDNLARFLLEEVLPEVQQHKTPDGRPILLSTNPNDRAAGGGSTGGIGAFTLAWERPDAFRRVFTAVGTFVGMRGGDQYPVLVRKTEPKPIRVFMQDGSGDEWMEGPELGDWWMANQTMERALEFGGYQVEHVWGVGTHNGKHPTAVFPEAMRSLWKGWPEPVTAGDSQNTFLKDILQPGEGWQAIPGGYSSASALAANESGEIIFRDAQGGTAWRLTPDQRLVRYPAIKAMYSGMAFGPDGRAYVTDLSRSQVIAYGPEGSHSTLTTGIRGSEIVVDHAANAYVTESGKDSDRPGNLWLIRRDGTKVSLDDDLEQPLGVALSPDGLWLAVAESKAHWGYSYRVQPDGTVKDKQRFYWFHGRDDVADSGASAWTMDRDGRLYAATALGVQVFDRNGRVRAILPAPGGEVTGISFGGNDFGTLFVSCSDHKIYRRKLKARGAPAWAAPIELPIWSPG